jgi:hypothetical protein
VRNRQHVLVEALLGGFDPGFEPITFPVLYPDQHNPCRLHKQNAQVAIAAPRDFAENRAVSRRDLLGHQSEPGAEVAALENTSPVQSAATMALEMIGPMLGAHEEGARLTSRSRSCVPT